MQRHSTAVTTFGIDVAPSKGPLFLTARATASLFFAVTRGANYYLLSFCLMSLGLSTLPSPAQVMESRQPHQVAIFDEGLASLRWRLERIRHARHSIDIEYFIYHDDASARLFSQALAEKARQGVRVRVLIDGLSILRRVDGFGVEEFRRQGIEVRHFNPASVLHPRLHTRNHRKHILVDGEEFITGGRNIEDMYFSMHAQNNFLDRDVWVRGPIAEQVQASFDKLWEHSWTKTLPLPRRTARPIHSGGSGGSHQVRARSQGRQKVLDKRMRRAKTFFHTDQTHAWRLAYQRRFSQVPFFEVDHIVYVSDLPHPHRGKNILLRYTEELLRDAKEVVMETPYFVLNERTFDFYGRLINRGMKFDVLTNSAFSTDSMITAAVHYAQAERYLQTGLRIRNYDGSFPAEEMDQVLHPQVRQARWGIHSKTFVMDNTAAIGTKNIDPRSQEINLENMVFFPNNKEIASYLRERIQTRAQRSFRVVRWDSEAGARQRLSGCEQKSLFGCLKFRLYRFVGLIFIDLI